MRRRIRFSITICALALAAACASPPPEQPATPVVSAQRGGDLYRDNCNVCHTAQVHWREKRLVRSWDDLLFQVSRWQAISGQGWSRDEIGDVAAYLNSVFYDLPCPVAGCRGSSVTRAQAVR